MTFKCPYDNRPPDDKMKNTIDMIDLYVSFAADTLIFISLISVTILLLYRNKHSTLSVRFKVSLFLLFTMMIFHNVRNIY